MRTDLLRSFRHRNMRLWLACIVCSLLLIWGQYATANSAAQATFTLSGKVTDQVNNPIASTIVDVLNVGTNTVVASDTTDANGDYSISIAAGMYDVRVTPPANSGFQVATIPNQNITEDTTLNFVLVPILNFVTLSGQVTNELGIPLPDQGVSLTSTSGASAGTGITDAAGNYSINVASGEYIIRVGYDNNPFSSHVPFDYGITSKVPLSLTQNTVFDIEVPAELVTVHVQDPSGNPVPGAGVESNPNGSIPINNNMMIGTLPANGNSYSFGSTDAAGNAQLWLFATVPGELYTLRAGIPPGSGLIGNSVSDVSVTGDTTVIISLLATVTLSGRVTNELGIPLPDQGVSLSSTTGQQGGTAITDAAGNYSINVASGEYIIRVGYDNNPFSSHVPFDYGITSKVPLSLTQNTVFDIEVPAELVTVHVQGPDGASVAGVGVESNPNGSIPINNNMMIGTLPANGSSYSSGTTNAAGDAQLWLFATDSEDSYTLRIVPPSPFQIFNVMGLNVPSNITQIVVLQYVHTPPITTISLAPDPNGQSIYPDPVTIMLSATAYSGYTIDATYYKVDGGAQQTYTVPFVVSGSGQHTIEYWSVDNIGVFESPKMLTFQIETPSSETPTFTITPLSSDTATPTETATETATVSWTPSNTATPTASDTATSTSTSTSTNTPTSTSTATETLTATPTPSATEPPTSTATLTATSTSSITPTPTPTSTSTPADYCLSLQSLATDVFIGDQTFSIRIENSASYPAKLVGVELRWRISNPPTMYPERMSLSSAAQPLWIKPVEMSPVTSGAQNIYPSSSGWDDAMTSLLPGAPGSPAQTTWTATFVGGPLPLSASYSPQDFVGAKLYIDFVGSGNAICAISPITGSTATPSNTSGPSSTATATRTSTNTGTPTRTFTPTRTLTASHTPTATRTATRTATPTRTLTASRTPTATRTLTNTATRTATSTPTKTRTPTFVPTATYTPSATNTVFYRAVNLGGAALIIDGNNWQANTGSTPNLSMNGTRMCNQFVTLDPPTDANRSTMIRCHRQHWAHNIVMSAVPNGTYQVSIYVWLDWEDPNPEAFSISVEGIVRVPSCTPGPIGKWDKLGPFTATITDGNINVTTSGGVANLSGLEVWRVN